MTAPPSDDITATRIDALLDQLADRDRRIRQLEAQVADLRGVLAIAAGRTP